MLEWNERKLASRGRGYLILPLKATYLCSHAKFRLHWILVKKQAVTMSVGYSYAYGSDQAQAEPIHICIWWQQLETLMLDSIFNYFLLSSFLLSSLIHCPLNLTLSENAWIDLFFNEHSCTFSKTRVGSARFGSKFSSWQKSGSSQARLGRDWSPSVNAALNYSTAEMGQRQSRWLELNTYQQTKGIVGSLNMVYRMMLFHLDWAPFIQGSFSKLRYSQGAAALNINTKVYFWIK